MSPSPNCLGKGAYRDYFLPLSSSPARWLRRPRTTDITPGRCRGRTGECRGRLPEADRRRMPKPHVRADPAPFRQHHFPFRARRHTRFRRSRRPSWRRSSGSPRKRRSRRLTKRAHDPFGRRSGERTKKYLMSAFDYTFFIPDQGTTRQWCPVGPLRHLGAAGQVRPHPAVDNDGTLPVPAHSGRPGALPHRRWQTSPTSCDAPHQYRA